MQVKTHLKAGQVIVGDVGVTQSNSSTVTVSQTNSSTIGGSTMG
jgi:hypothetical protein